MDIFGIEDRRREIELARENGETYAAIAKRYGISACRVMQIFKSKDIKLKRQMIKADTRAASHEELGDDTGVELE